MKVIIDIPEYIYKLCQGHGDPVYGYIANGTPLPKHHGRLMILSENRLKENQVNLDFSCQKWISEVGLSNATVKIIEADKSESKNITNLCNQCSNKRCIFQSGIVRNRCDFYKAKSEGKE